MSMFFLEIFLGVYWIDHSFLLKKKISRYYPLAKVD